MMAYQWPMVSSLDEKMNDSQGVGPNSSLKQMSPTCVSFPKLYMESTTECFSIDTDLGLKKPHNHDNSRAIFPAEAFDKTRFIPSHPDSFFASMKPTLFIFQGFGLLPVSGLGATNHTQIKFEWISWKMLYVLINFIGISFIFICSIILCFRYGFTYDRSAPVVFYGSAVLNIYLFFNLAQHWGKLNMRVAHTEYLLRDYGFPSGQGRKFVIITVIFIFFALIEHLLSKVIDAMKDLPCIYNSIENYDHVLSFFLSQYVQVFSLVSYHLVFGILLLLFNFSATVCWNLTDLFLGLMGLSLASRLKQINLHLASFHGMDKPTSFWKKTREEFNAMSVLVKQVDEKIQQIMLLSLGDNLFFICLQLLKSLKKRINVYQSVYFFWSFGFLILRTCFVTLCASGVFDESRESKTVLYSVPTESFCHEVRRFLTQLSTDELTLTGCRFFSVTRGLILTIAGTVVTYEIVLVQFKTDTGVDDWTGDNNVTSCVALPND